MRAMVFEEVGRPLRAVERPIPTPAPGQLLLEVHACGVCRTDLHLLDGEVPIAALPRILGHQIVGTVEERGAGTGGEVRAPVAQGQRVGVPWLGWTCGECAYCRSGRENLCPCARFTGRDIDGGMAEYAVADERFCFAIPPGYPDEQAAPLLCAGLIGYRALRMTGRARSLGLYGFGAAAHILAQVAIWQGRRVYAFTRPGDMAAQTFALELGAAWAGSSQESPPEQLDAAIVFAPDGALVPLALRAVAPGGTVVCGGIHMSDVPAFPYSILWEERTLRSVANLTRRDAEEFLALAPRVPVKTQVTAYPLEDADGALGDLRAGRFTGAAVLTLR
ncbi:MAG: zinc-dependent alcohol dehydrogenase family protein [Solirubrobacteraceae bacterium]